MLGRRKLVSTVGAAGVIALAAVLIVRFVLLGPSPAEASFTTLSVVSGTVEVRENDAKDFRPAVDGETLNVGDTVRTGPDARAVITFFEGSTVEMEPETELTMEKLEGQEEGGFLTRLRQSAGVTWHRVVDFVDPRSRYEVNTPAAAVAVRGTVFQVQVEPDGTTTVGTFKGQVAVSAGGVEKIVEEGTGTRVVPGGHGAGAFPFAFVPGHAGVRAGISSRPAGGDPAVDCCRAGALRTTRSTRSRGRVHPRPLTSLRPCCSGGWFTAPTRRFCLGQRPAPTI